MKVRITARGRAHVRGRRSWWVQHPRTHSHVYFFLDESAGAVVVLAVWGAARGRAPKL